MKERKGNHKAQKGRVQFGVLQKLLIGILVPLFAVLIVMGVFLGLQGASTVDDVMGSDLDAETRAAANQVESFFNKYYGIAECLSATQIIRDTTTEVTEGGIAAHRLYGSLLETLRLIQQNYEEDIDFIWVANLKTGQILQNDGTIYEKSQVDYTTRSWYSLVMDAQDTITTEAYVSANNDSLMLTVASPVFVDGSIEGIIGIDLNMDHLNQILSTIKVGDTGYITLYDLQNEIVYHPDSSVMGTNAEDANYSSNMLNAILNKQNISSTLYTRGGTEYYGSTTAIDAVGYTVLGVMPVAEYTAHINTTIRILIIGVLGCGILLALICVLIALSITRPLKHLNTAVGKLADGELDVDVKIQSHDEVSQVGANVARIVTRLKEYILYIDEISRVLSQIGQGDLVFTLQQEYVGEFAKVKLALLDIRRTLTETMSSITQSADQVNAGAEQIASGAQALAQGATEQASSVQELAASVQELSNQVGDEAGKAVEAGQALQRIKEEAEKCDTQMDLMRKAMQDISIQSTSIRSIIKTINDIAFQTNILALNAAVEAARAGTAGKGFSVVADEVRSLAGKSAEAAAKTNELIENSVRAVKHGEELTQKTADSLAIVAEGTKQVVDTVNGVSQAYHDQADRLSEIAKGVDQISEVVQTNSATAEESAAASEELSGQATMLKDLIGKFHLSDVDSAYFD